MADSLTNFEHDSSRHLVSKYRVVSWLEQVQCRPRPDSRFL